MGHKSKPTINPREDWLLKEPWSIWIGSLHQTHGTISLHQTHGTISL